MTNKLDRDYLNLCCDIIENGKEKGDRTGTGTMSVFGRQIRHKMSDGFPLLTTKKMSLKNIATELRWFLNGDTNIKYLLERGCKIWTGDAFKRYVRECSDSASSIAPWLHVDDETGGIRLHTKDEFEVKIISSDIFAKKWGELGPIYGAQWTNWEDEVNQISNLVSELKSNPDSRRLMVNAWNVAEIGNMVLPPCHYGFQVYTRMLTDDEISPELLKIRKQKHQHVKLQEYARAAEIREAELALEKIYPTRAISLMWNQRSVDTALGLPYNIASYAMLLMMLANEVNMMPDELIGNLGDTHLYLNHMDGIAEQIGVLTLEERIESCPDYLELYMALENPAPQLFTETHWESQKARNIDYHNSKDGGTRDTIIDHMLIMLKIPNLKRPAFPLPTLKLTGGIDTPLDGTDYELIDYKSHPAIKFPLSN